MKKMKSIKGKIMMSVILLMSVSIFIVGVFCIYMNYANVLEIREQTLGEVATLSATRIEKELVTYRNVVAELGCIARLTNPDVSLEDKKAIVDQKVATYHLVEGNVVGKDGISIFNGVDSSEREYFKVAIKGETFISDPVVSKTTGKMTFILAAPVWKGGIPNSTVEGVVILIPNEEFLNDIVRSIKVSENSYAYILGSKGLTVAHPDADVVKETETTAELAKSDSSLNQLADLEAKMIAGENGTGNYSYGGIKKYMGYAPIAETKGWSVAVLSPESDFISKVYISIFATIIIMIILLAIVAIVIRKIAGNIGTPIKICAERLDLLAKGDLKTTVPDIHSDDETGVLADSTRNIVEGMNTMISDINYLFHEMSNNNFNIKSKAEASYVGDFHTLYEDVGTLSKSISKTLIQIENSAGQVSVGAEQMAEGAQNLAEGTTDQAGAVEELLATVTDVTEKVQSNAKEASDTSKSAQKIGLQAQESTTQMKGMTSAMQRISEASNEIANVIKTIEDIASQTNLLSLNASIEAARAGEAGKGFAVVAGEIGQLANQSAVAVEDTRKLIKTALDEVENGSGMVDSTAQSLQNIIDGIEEIVKSIEEVSVSSIHQAEVIEQINLGVEQISGVVQTNSATAEESSATSEALSMQALTLNDLVGMFVLDDSVK